jgi:hypothetical protein
MDFPFAFVVVLFATTGISEAPERGSIAIYFDILEFIIYLYYKIPAQVFRVKYVLLNNDTIRELESILLRIIHTEST